MAFKTKIKNRLLVDDRQTLDAKHSNVLQTFNDNKNYIPDIKNELNEITQKLNSLHIENNKSPVLNITLQNQIWQLDDRKKELEKELFDIENNIEENNYMLKTGKILSQYYKIIDEEKQFASGNSNISVTDNTMLIGNGSDGNNTKKKTIMDWFTPSTENKIVFENIDTGKKKIVASKKKQPLDKQSITTPNNINSNTTSNANQTLTTSNKNTTNITTTTKTNPTTTTTHTNSNFTTTANTISNNTTEVQNTPIQNKPTNKYNKDTIYDKYMKMTDKNYINVNNDDVDIFDMCKFCKIEMLLNNNTGVLICPKCGLMENIIVDSDKPSFKEPPKEMTSFCYKRINHLNEFLAQFQAKETTEIHEDVYNEILMEIKKERITNMATITPEKMRELLRRIKKNDYYEHIPYIINQLNGLPAPVIAPEIEEIIRGMFKAIQIPFEKYCPPKRKNFLSYSYIMYKFFELLELDEYLRCFQLLKSRTKLHQQDEIWKNICKDLNWQFIKSIT